MARIFIGVAWPYSNNAQHFGHVAGVYLPADIFARYHRLKGNAVLMVSGSDMHGTPTAVAAEKEGVAPEVIAERFHKLNSESLRRFGISYDLFTHTSTKKHAEVVHEIFLELLKHGFIYNGRMRSSYCPGCARFLPDRYVDGTCPHCKGDDARGDQCSSCGKLLDPDELINPRCKLCGKPAELRETEHFFLRLTAFRDRLAEFIADKAFWKGNVLNFTRNILAQGLRDRAVTRDIEYGVTIPVKGYEKKRIYVWFEAVCGYYSASKAWAEAKGKPDDWEKFWKDPECRHFYFLGKDNIMFHTIIWPSILLGCGGLSLPYNVPANEHLTLGGEKISKSKTKDTSIWLPDYLDVYKPDAMRYYLTIHMPELHDTAFTWEEFFEKNNTELVGAYGNFIHRVLTFTFSNIGAVPRFHEAKATDEDRLALDRIKDATGKIGDYIESCQFKNALETLIQLAHFGNRYFNSQAPWKLLKADRERCETVLNVSLRLVSAMAVLSEPFMPHSAERLWAMLGNDGSVHSQKWDSAGSGLKDGTRLPKPEVLFSRLGDVPVPEPGRGESGKATGGTAMATIEGDAGTTGKVRTMDGIENELAKLDIRIAKIISVENHPNADKLYVLSIDLGNGDVRSSVAGLKKYYKPEELLGKQVAVVANLEPATLRGVQSKVMLLAAEDSGGVGALVPSRDAELSDRVTPGKTVEMAQLKFEDFQKMDIRVGVVREAGHDGLVVDAEAEYRVFGETLPSPIPGTRVVIIADTERNAAILATAKGTLITTDREIALGSKVR